MNGIATVTNAAGQSPRRCAGSAGLPMVPDRIRNELPSGAPTQQVIAVLSRQRLRARRGNEERRERKEIDDDV